jgi:ribosomal protein L7/L12
MSDTEEQGAGLAERVTRLEAQVALLMRNLGMSEAPPPEWQVSPEVAELISRGDKKEAIRLVREQSGASLKDALLIVESFHVSRG